MNNFSFLESAQQQAQQQQQHNQSRPPPSPSHSQAGSIAASQVNGGGQNGVPMVNGLPSGGQQTDMNHLWAVVQQLSQLLEENKAQTRGIVEGVAAIQGRAALEEGGEVGGAAGQGGRAPMREINGEINGISIAVCRGTTLTFHSSNPGASPKPAYVSTIDHCFSHGDECIALCPPHRLRICFDSSARQAAPVRLLANVSHPRASQALPDSPRPGAIYIYGIETRTRRMAGWTESSGR